MDEAAAAANIPAAAVVSARQAARGQRITVSQAFEKALAVEKSADNRHHIASAMRVALAAWGDAPLSAIGREEFVSLLLFARRLLLFARRLPIDHGRKHGRNRYKTNGVEVSKHDEIARADRRDAALRAELDALDRPPREREARLQAGLTRRLNEKTLKKNHSFVRRAFAGLSM